MKVVVLAVLAVGVFQPVALTAVWTASCNDGMACVWKHGNFVVPRAGANDSVGNYQNYKYPNTQENMNDSVSSISNRSYVYDDFWFFNAGYSGTYFCVPSRWQSPSLGNHNDEYSSHLEAHGSNC